ncbi:MAG: ABC transporter ATP-binding protein [Bdellovibrionaceae bacterium]|nr:ABC transporter ATP-binding protein [Pseudobdellovibrionaceae bacterium]
MIEVRDLTKSYGLHKAIDRLNFSVNKGEVVGFLGPNGAGKTTTMKIITGFMAPTSGQVKVAGLDVFEDPVEVKKRIGYLPETPPVYGDMTVEEYLRFVAHLKGAERAKIPSLVARAIEKTNLGDVRKRLIQNLSKGFRQRVGISGAIVSDPEILILDEPTVGLDPRQVAEIRALVKELAGQHTILLSTHILPEVQASCERIIIINRGRIVAEDSLDGLTKRMSGSGRVVIRVRRAIFGLAEALGSITGVRHVAAVSGSVQSGQASSNGNGNGLGAVSQVAGEVVFEIETDGAEDTIEKIAAQVVGQGAGLMEMKSESVNLENVFLQLTSSEEQQGSNVAAGVQS